MRFKKGLVAALCVCIAAGTAAPAAAETPEQARVTERYFSEYAGLWGLTP